MADVQVSLQLEVKPGGKILVPGCEPTSAMSSRTLGMFLQKTGRCKNALVPLNSALAAIPGSYVKFASNFGRGGAAQRWFVFPPTLPGCPCPAVIDYYDMLRNIAVEELPPTEEFDKCNIAGMGYCPSPDFETPSKPDPYIQEGTFPGDVGILPPLPPWGSNP
jgi:hypothetical protein